MRRTLNHAEVCPICQGEGNIVKSYSPLDHTTTKTTCTYTCNRL